MADAKISALPSVTAPLGADNIPLVESGTTSQVTVGNLIGTGWVSCSESWSYASATTITVPSDATTKYQVGDKIKITQTTVKYFYIVAVAATTLTVATSTDYTVANAAISANFYSRAVRPFDFASWMAYTPTHTASSGTFSGETVTDTANFMIIGQEMIVRGTTTFGALGAGSPAGEYQLSYPVGPTITDTYNTGAGREYQSTGKIVAVDHNSSKIIFRFADNSTVIVNGYVIHWHAIVRIT
jgi:hypothetical protein